MTISEPVYNLSVKRYTTLYLYPFWLYQNYDWAENRHNQKSVDIISWWRTQRIGKSKQIMRINQKENKTLAKSPSKNKTKWWCMESNDSQPYTKKTGHLQQKPRKVRNNRSTVTTVWSVKFHALQDDRKIYCIRYLARWGSKWFLGMVEFSFGKIYWYLL
jgi:hypothetical protein